jgi:hypothetical protein
MLETHVEVFAAGTTIKIWHKAALTTNSIVLQTSPQRYIQSFIKHDAYKKKRT